MNEASVIDFYWLIDTIDINQIEFIDWYIDTDFYRLNTPDAQLATMIKKSHGVCIVWYITFSSVPFSWLYTLEFMSK